VTSSHTWGHHVTASSVGINGQREESRKEREDRSDPRRWTGAPITKRGNGGSRRSEERQVVRGGEGEKKVGGGRTVVGPFLRKKSRIGTM